MRLYRTTLILLAVTLLIGCQSRGEDMLYRTLEHDGLKREYFVHVPDGANDTFPLMLVLHGYTSTATGFATMHDLNRHADDHSYIAVYPQGSYFMAENDEPNRVTSWNLFGDAVPEPESGPQCVDDAAEYPCPGRRHARRCPTSDQPGVST